MNKLTRYFAVGITSVFAVGALSAPVAAAAPGVVETAICVAVGPQITDLTAAVTSGNADLADLQTAMDDAQGAMEAAGTALGVAGLDYIQAIDSVGDVTGTLDAFVDAAADFSEAVTDWIDAVDAHGIKAQQTSLQQSVLNYLEGLCVNEVL